MGAPLRARDSPDRTHLIRFIGALLASTTKRSSGRRHFGLEVLANSRMSIVTDEPTAPTETVVGTDTAREVTAA